MTYKFLVLLLFLLFQGQTSPQYKIGEKVKNFTLKNVIDNKSISLNDFSDKKAVVIIFISFSCPYSKIYEDRLLQLVKEYENQNIKFLFINSQTSSTEDKPEFIEKWRKEKGISFPYLTDPNQTVARQFFATKTPEAFVLKNLNGNFVLQYRGAIDDNPQAAQEVSSSYLKDAIDSTLTDSALKVTEKRATGCIIR